MVGRAAWLASGALCFAVHTAEPPASPFDEQLHDYKTTTDSGDVKRLQDRIASGAAALRFEPAHGYLLSLLEQLQVPVSSQLLVASKTSPNKALITPHSPRAIYFNDRVSVAYVPAAELLEIAAADPHLGVAFYTLDQKASEKPRLVRDDRCLECHASAKTLDVPGWMVRSFQTKEDGEVDVLSGLLVTHRTPIAQRWGGYYVTGTHGSQSHRGNLFGEEQHENGNITDLSRFLDVSKYPFKASDITALMVMEHQAYAQTLLTRLAFDSKKALARDELRTVFPLCETVLKYMLFVDEAPIKAPIHGSPEFADWFEHQGPKDKRGRSLRQLDLNTRLFQHPCSYMIYSQSFDALPEPMRRHFYRRLHQVLTGEDKSADFSHLSADQRQTVLQILLDTVDDLPADWGL